MIMDWFFEFNVESGEIVTQAKGVGQFSIVSLECKYIPSRLVV